MNSKILKIDWNCKLTWKKSIKNTSWCLLGCSIGDFGTIFFFQITEITFPILEKYYYIFKRKLSNEQNEYWKVEDKSIREQLPKVIKIEGKKKIF